MWGVINFWRIISCKDLPRGNNYPAALKDEFKFLIGIKALYITTLSFLVVSALTSPGRGARAEGQFLK